jgi:hypothetical protein
MVLIILVAGSKIGQNFILRTEIELGKELKT